MVAINKNYLMPFCQHIFLADPFRFLFGRIKTNAAKYITIGNIYQHEKSIVLCAQFLKIKNKHIVRVGERREEKACGGNAIPFSLVVVKYIYENPDKHCICTL